MSRLHLSHFRSQNWGRKVYHGYLPCLALINCVSHSRFFHICKANQPLPDKVRQNKHSTLSSHRWQEQFLPVSWEVYRRTIKVLLSQHHLPQNDLCSDSPWPMSEDVNFPFTLVKALSTRTRGKIRCRDLSNRLLSSGQTSLSKHLIHTSRKTKKVSHFRYILRMRDTCRWPFNRLVLRAPFGRPQ